MGAFFDGRKVERARRWVLLALVTISVAGAVGYVWWSTSVHEFRGKLVYPAGPPLIYPPEYRRPTARLVTATGTYDLYISAYDVGGSDRKLQLMLESMSGKEVIVRGKLAGGRNTRVRPGIPGREPSPVINVKDLRATTSNAF